MLPAGPELPLFARLTHREGYNGTLAYEDSRRGLEAKSIVAYHRILKHLLCNPACQDASTAITMAGRQTRTRAPNIRVRGVGHNTLRISSAQQALIVYV